MTARNPLLLIAPSFVAAIYAAGPSVAAVHCDLARQTDFSQQQRQHQKSEHDQKTPIESSNDASPNVIAAAPMKPVETESGSGSLLAAIDSPAQYSSTHKTFDIAATTAIFVSSQLHRPIYQAHAPPFIAG